VSADTEWLSFYFAVIVVGSASDLNSKSAKPVCMDPANVQKVAEYLAAVTNDRKPPQYSIVCCILAFDFEETHWLLSIPRYFCNVYCSFASFS
jgi:hypothetical protein